MNCFFMKKLSVFFYSFSKLWTALLLTGLMIAYASLIMGSRSDCFLSELNEDQTVLGLKFGYSYEDANSFLNSLSEEAVICYKNLLRVWDSVFPIVYGLMYISWLSLLYKKLGKNGKPLLLINLFPLIPMLADWAENSSELFMISNYTATNEISESAVFLSSLITQIKWSLSSLNYIIILTGITLLIKKKLTDKTKNNG